MPLAARAVAGANAGKLRDLVVTVMPPSDTTRAAGTGSGAWTANVLMPAPSVKGRHGLNPGVARNGGIDQGPHRLVVRTSRCGRDNPGSTPGVVIFCDA